MTVCADYRLVADEGDGNRGGVSAAAGGSGPKLNAFAVAIILFASVAGGPYGIEPAVGSAGALPVLLGSIALAFAWSAPQALMAAEMSTMFPSNGGYITWVVKGCGPVLGYVNAANSIMSAICNLPLYPVLFASYVQQLAPSLTDGELWAIKLVGLVLTVTLNSLGIEAVSLTNTLFSIVVQTPFILIPIAAAVYRQPTFDWSGAAAVVPDWQASFSVFVSTLCWNALGWVNIGNIASDVKNPRVSYPLGAGLAVLLVALNYLYPVFFCTALAPDMSQWQVGYFVDVGTRVANWVGIWAAVAAAFSCMNNFQPQLGTTARALRFAALYRMLPIPWLDRNWQRFNTPLPALLLQGGLVAILMSFGFNILVTINVLFYNVGLLLQFVAFVRLRYTQPDLPRPFAVPGGMAMAWALMITIAVVVGIGFYAAATTAWWAMVTLACANVAFAAMGWVWSRWVYTPTLVDEVDAAQHRGGRGGGDHVIGAPSWILATSTGDAEDADDVDSRLQGFGDALPSGVSPRADTTELDALMGDGDGTSPHTDSGASARTNGVRQEGWDAGQIDPSTMLHPTPSPHNGHPKRGLALN